MPRTMKKAKTNVISKKRRTEFYLHAPDVGEIFLVGDFNGWDVRKHLMKRDDNGVWRKTVILQPGRYEYKFLIDGRWQTDPGNERVCWNCFGTQNNVIDVQPL